MLIGERIKKLRKSKKLSGKTFSQSIGINAGYLSQIEHGEKIPSDKIVMLIEKTYGVSLRSGVPPPKGVNEQAAPYSSYPADVQNDIKILIEVMTSGEADIKTALRANLVEFRNAVRNNRRLRELERDVEALKKVLDREDPSGEGKGETSGG